MRAPLRSRTSCLGLAGGFAGLGGQQALLARSTLAVLGFSSRYLREEVADGRVDDAFDLAVAELGLRLAFELRLRARGSDDDGGEAFAEVVAGGDEVLEEVLPSCRRC